MMEQFKLLSTSAILAVLIWWGADSLVNESATVRVYFEPIAPAASPDMRVAVEGTSPAFRLEVSGRRRALEELRSRGQLKLRITVPEQPTGPAVVALERNAVRQALADQSAELRKIAVVSVQPEALSVRVDHLTTREIPLVAKKFSLTFDSEPQWSRSKVSVRLRESQLQVLSPEFTSQYDLATDIDRAMKDQPVGKPVTVTVAVDARRFGPDAEVSPSAVDVTATIQSQRVTAQISTVPVLLAVSASNLPLSVQPADRDGQPLALLTQTITVAGQRDDIQKLQRGETRAFGFIQLKQEDFDSLNLLKLATPEYRLPKGVELAQDAQPLEFKLIPVAKAGLRVP